MFDGKRTSHIDDLKRKLQCDWPAIVEARETTAKRRTELGNYYQVRPVDPADLATHLIPEDVPVILETLIDPGQSTIDAEVRRASQALSATVPVAV